MEKLYSCFKCKEKKTASNFSEKELSLARTEEAIKCKNHCDEAVAEYQAEFVKLAEGMKKNIQEIIEKDSVMDAINSRDSRAYNVAIDDIKNLIISPNKE